MSGGRNRGCGGGRRTALSAERAAQARSPGAGVARQGAARARWLAIMLAGDQRAEARLGRRREPLLASRGRGGRGRGGRGQGGAGGGLSGAGPRPSRWAAGAAAGLREIHGILDRAQRLQPKICRDA